MDFVVQVYYLSSFIELDFFKKGRPVEAEIYPLRLNISKYTVLQAFL